MTDAPVEAVPEDGVKAASPFWLGLGFQVAVGMALGVVVGLVWPDFAASLKLLGDIFLRLVKTVVAPLVFLTVTVGVVAAGDFRRVGKLGVVAMIYFEVVSSVALVFGLAMGWLAGVGRGVGHVAVTAGAARGAAAAQASAKAPHATAADFILNIFPDNLLGAFAKGEILQVLVIALIFGGALLMLKPARRAPIEAALEALSPAMYQFTHIIMRLAPVGAFGAMAYTIGSNGVAVLVALGWWVIAYYLTQIAFIVVVLGGVCLAFRLDLFDILRFIKDEILIVLGTASSDSVLPRLLEKLPAYGVSKQAAGLILPTGYVFNLDGASIYLSMGVIFLSNAYNVHLSLAQVASILGLMLLTSKGVATVAGGSFVTFAATVTATGVLPVEGLPLMFGVYRLMAPANSTCNAISNAVASIVVAKLCGEYDPGRRVPAKVMEI
jgi:aerobic C4-dicarboxylate transport protein